MKALDRILGVIETSVLTVGLIIMVGVMFAQGVLGEALHIRWFSWPWALDLAKYLMVWTMGAGAAVAVRERRHIAVDAITRLLPARARKAITFIIWLICAAACAAAVSPTWAYVRQARESGMTSDTLGIHLWYAYLALPLAAALLFVRFAMAAVEDLVADKQPGPAAPGAPVQDAEAAP